MLPHAKTRSVLLALLALTALRLRKARRIQRICHLSQHRVGGAGDILRHGRNNHVLETLTKADFAVVDGERCAQLSQLRTFRGDRARLGCTGGLERIGGTRFRVAIGDVLQLVAREQPTSDDRIAVLSFGGRKDYEARSGRRRAFGLSSSVRVDAMLPTPWPNYRRPRAAA